MKQIVLSISMIFFLSINCVNAKSILASAQHIRLWRGYKLSNLSFKTFHNKLSSNFLPETARVPGKFGLKTYIVAIPPENNNSNIPDEIAFLVYSSKNDYKRMYSTEEGRNYGASHWNVFNRKISNTKVPLAFNLAIAKANKTSDLAFDVLDKSVNWNLGYTVVYLGLRKKDIQSKEFVPRVHWYFNTSCSLLSSHGLQGYIALLANDYVIEIMNWKDSSSMKKVFVSTSGKAIMKYKNKLLKSMLWETPKPFDNRIVRGSVVSVKIQD